MPGDTLQPIAGHRVDDNRPGMLRASLIKSTEIRNKTRTDECMNARTLANWHYTSPLMRAPFCNHRVLQLPLGPRTHYAETTLLTCVLPAGDAPVSAIAEQTATFLAAFLGEGAR